MTAEEVNAMAVGSTVLLSGKDQAGEDRETVCTIAGRPPQKFLTYRIKGEIHSCRIKDYPGKSYKREIKGGRRK